MWRKSSVATDIDDDRVYLASSLFNLKWTADKNAEIKFVDETAIFQASGG